MSSSHIQGLEVEQRLSTEQVLELRQTLSQKLSIELLRIFDSSVSNPADLLFKVLQQLVGSVNDQFLQEGLVDLTKSSHFQSQLLDDFTLLALPTNSRLKEVALNFLFNCYNGRFPNLDSSNSNAIFHLEVSKGKYTTAMNMSMLDSEKNIEALQDLLRTSTGTDSTFEELREKNSALTIRKQYSDTVKKITLYLQLLCQMNGQMLVSFFRDLVVIQRLNLIFADKIQSRFVRQFRVSRKSETVEVNILNTIAEFVFVGMGIISFDLFSHMAFKQDGQYSKDIEQALADAGLNIDMILSHYNLQDSGMVFFHRWALNGHKLSRITDGLIYDFVCKTVRKDKIQLLATLEFDDMIDEIKDLKSEKLNPEEFDVQLRELFVGYFTKTEFVDLIKNLIKTRWYKHLAIFM
jgi:hypothetical protein